MSTVESRLAKLELRNKILSVAVVGMSLLAAASWLPAQPAHAEPKPSEKTVEADEVLAKDIDVERLTVTRSLILKDAGGKAKISLLVKKADGGPGIIIESPDFQFLVASTGVSHKSTGSGAIFGIATDDTAGYRLISKDGKGALRINLPEK